MRTAQSSVQEVQSPTRPHTVSQQPTTTMSIRTENLSVIQRLAIAQAEWRKVLSANPNATDNPVNRELVLTADNMRTNKFWGDELIEKGEDVLRVYAANVNGFSLDRRGGQYDNFCRTIKEVQADIACGQEHNLDTMNSSVRSIVHNTTQQHWKRNRTNFASSQLKFENLYKPGGTFILSVGEVTSRLCSRFQDKWGRWTSQTFQGRRGRQVTVISAYQVVTDNPARGTTTAAAQQFSLLLQTQDAINSPRVAFRRDLQEYIQQCRGKGQEILLTGDFNECIGLDPDGMTGLLIKCGLINVMTRKHTLALPTTYARGHRCLDYAFATELVASAVERAGYEPFNSRFPTDHRSYFLDLSISTLFDIQLQPLAKCVPRVLQSTNVNQVTAYIETKYEYLCKHNVFERIKQLERPGDRHRFAERLDKDVVEASLAAEKKIKRYGEPFWSVALAQARKKEQVIKKCISMIKTRIANSDTIQKDWSKAGFDGTFPTSLRVCKTILKHVKQEVSDLVKNSYQQREQEHKQRVESLSKSMKKSDKDEATRLRHLQKAEAINQLFSKLRSLQQIQQKTGVTRIEVPSPSDADPKTCNSWVQVDIPDEVAKHLLTRNQRHFGQASGTPFTTHPLNTDLGFDGQAPAAEEILYGNYEYGGCDPNVKTLIRYIKQIASVQALPIQPTITEKEFCGKLKVWRESTTTSPSGMHLGHYKALLGRHRYTNMPEDEDEEHRTNREKWNRMQEEMLAVHLTLLNYGLSRGYSFQRWRKVANTILFKDPGVIKIHRTRVIHLYEADYNLAMGLKWRAATFRAEVQNLLHNGQFGSRPRRNAVDPVFVEEMQFEISRITRKTFAQTNYDATACYDRIVPNLAVLASRAYGVPKEVTATNARTLEGASYHVRTELGVSKENYTHNAVDPIYGTGQGSGNSPAIWCFISSLLYHCYDEDASPASYCFPDKTHHVSIGMIGFVDDSNGQTNAFHKKEDQNTLMEIHGALKQNAQLWANLLRTSGGALELSKCSVHVAHWAFTNQGSPVLLTDKDRFSDIAVVDPTQGLECQLQYLSPYSAHKTLGHFKEPAGTQVKQLQELKLKSDTNTRFLQTCSLTRDEAWTYYYACYLPSVSYSLANSFFTKSQLTKIQRNAMKLIVPKCGYNRNMKQEILYGPLQYGGANFRHLHDQQGLGQLNLFMRHWRQDNEAGKLLKVAVAWSHYATGMGKSLFEDTSTPLPHLEAKWIASLRSYLNQSQITLQVETQGIPPLEREHDVYLMEEILRSNWFTEKEIVRLNYCRLYLNAVTLSDITNTIGDRLDDSKQVGETSLMSANSKWMEVNQSKPSDSEWKLWTCANRLWSNSKGQLHQPLGKWVRDQRECRIQHFAYKYRRWLYIRNMEGRYIVCRRTGKEGVYNETTEVLEIQDVPRPSQPAEVAMTGATKWYLVHTTKVTTGLRKRQSMSSTNATFENFLEALDIWEYDLLRHSKLAFDPFTVSSKLGTGFSAGSDGSEKFGTDGAFGWSLSTIDGVRTAWGMGPSRGLKMDSYRAECSGMLSILRFLVRLGEYTRNAEQWNGTVGTDSQSMLKTLFGQDNVIKGTRLGAADSQELDVMTAEWDLLIEIQTTLRHLPGVTLTYVKGHQDADHDYSTLPLMAQLNVDADNKAREYQEKYGKAHPFSFCSPHAGVLLQVPEGTLTAKIIPEVRSRITGPPLQHYIQKRNTWSDQTMRRINWRAHAKALSSQIQNRVHFTKLVHDCLPTNYQLNKIRKDNKKYCPACPNEERNETRDHILRCSHDERVRWRNQFQKDIQNFHHKEATSPVLQHLWREAIDQWFTTEDDDDIEVSPIFYPAEVRRVIIHQNTIGWRQVFNGRFAVEWELVQDAYYSRTTSTETETSHKRRTGLRWQQRFILEIWKSWRKLWKMRNEMVHGKDKEELLAGKDKCTREELHRIYDHRARIEPDVQRLLFQDIQDHMQRPLGMTRNWLNINRPVFQASLRRAKKRAVQGVRSIRSYFAPVRQDTGTEH